MTTPSQSQSFPEIEQDILKFWEENNTFMNSLQQSKEKPIYAFYDGPPFATGLPHHGHLLASTIKDIIPRYFTMTGHYVERRFGWDCHGLPIEYEIDKKLGKSTAEVVAEKGIQGYNNECRGIVQRYVKEWKKTITRIGRWVDFDNDYKTMNPEFMESVWWVFKQLWEKELIYRGTKVMPFSTALGTGLSNFEAGSNYQDVQDPSITVLLKLEDEDSFLAIWTTTPWTLPSNLGVCVNAEIDYLQVRHIENQQTFYIAKARYEHFNKNEQLDIIRELKGRELVGRSYTPLFPYFKDAKNDGAFRVYADDFVSTDNGTGLVHMAPAFGEDDARVMQSAGVTTLACPVDDNGLFTREVTEFAGQYVKDADKNIIKHLKTQDRLLDHSVIVHSYPFCPRSDTPLIYKAVPSWYVKVEAIKDRLIANNEKTNWVPSHIKHGRFGKWLEGARDWAISRNRVWGTPLPLWINDTTGKIHCVGSIEELETLTQSTVTDLHRDNVDHLTFSLPGEEGTYQRIVEVLDCWFESGSMPYAQQHYPFKNKDYFQSAFPAEFIAEGLDQTRGWFYLLSVLSTALFDQPAFKNVIVNGIVMAEDGKKMSKRLKNYTPPDDLMEVHGADALRLYLINSGLVKAEEQRFADDGVKDMVRRTLLPYLNAFKFFETYATVDQWSIDKHCQPASHILDRFILSRMQSLKSLISTHMTAYKLYNVVPELLRFIDDLTNIYIRLNRARFWAEDMSEDKRAAFTTLFIVLSEFTTCMAPFTPFLAEHIYQALKPFSGLRERPQSVHLCDYPTADAALIDLKLESGVALLQQVLILGRQKRNEQKIKIKTPLKELCVIHKDTALLNEVKKCEAILKKELNLKHITYSTNESEFITLYAKPNSPVLGKRLQKRFGQFKKSIENLASEQIEQVEQGQPIELDGEIFEPSDILVFREPKAGSDVLSNRHISVLLDTTLDQSLIDEGLAREVVNRIQKTRKELQLNVSDRINIVYESSEDLALIIERHRDYICRETLCIKLQTATDFIPDCSEEIDAHTLAIKLEKKA